MSIYKFSIFKITILVLISAGILIGIKISSAQLVENKNEIVILGDWTQSKLENLIKTSSKIPNQDKRVDFISRQFLGVPYEGSTLTGDTHTPEIFTINLKGMDCFTYIDYVEAMRLSDSYSEFREKLKEVRYASSKVSFENRNHFFTDWRIQNKQKVSDVTDEVGKGETKTVEKKLNKKSDDTSFLPGIPVKRRIIKYIPSEAVDEQVMKRLRTGDYVGIYSNADGLDVSHTGIIIKQNEKTLLRHASSNQKNGKVVDEDLKQYLVNKPGLIVFRPK